jgi:hypothetical protein
MQLPRAGGVSATAGTMGLRAGVLLLLLLGCGLSAGQQARPQQAANGRSWSVALLPLRKTKRLNKTLPDI